MNFNIPQHNNFIPDTERNQECEIHHAQQENINLKLVAYLTQRWPFIPLALIVSELLLKSTKSE